MEPESSHRLVAVVSGFLLVVITVMANAYWVEGVRWADKADEAAIRKDTSDEARCVKYMRRSKWVFQLVALLMLATMCATVLPVAWPKTTRIAIIIDVFCMVAVVLFCIIYVSGRFIVPLR